VRSFLLIHGAWHGGWCWQPLQQHLTAAGLASVAIELPGDVPGRFLGDDAALAFDAFQELDGDVIVVGHSLAGLLAPFVATHPRVCGLAMVAALFPQFDVSAAEQRDRNPGIYADAYRSAPIIRHPDGSTEVAPETAIDLMFNTCEPEVASWAAGQLRRQYWEVFGEPSPVWAWPDVPTLVVGCTQDRVTATAPMRASAAAVPRAEYLELDCDHSPMLSVPGDLAELLIRFANRLDLI
jgi:pimeloyl-ACP methyl ester carboxylesterase